MLNKCMFIKDTAFFASSEVNPIIAPIETFLINVESEILQTFYCVHCCVLA